jgi:ankyrin repeat protein
MSSLQDAAERDFFCAVQAGEVERVRRLVEKAPELLNAYSEQSFGATPLTAACFGNRMAMVEALLDLGADPNRRSDWKMGPWSPLHCAVYQRNRALVDLLLARGAILDVHTAAGQGWADEVARLLDADPTRVNERGGDGCQPLHFADTIEVAQMLLARGAEIDGRCIDHYSTPAQYLCTVRPEVARYLFSRGATANIFSAVAAGDLGCVETLIAGNASLIEARIDQRFFPPGSEHDVHNILTFTIGHGATPLHAAARVNNGEAVELLVKRGMSPEVRGGYDEATPLHLAAWHDSLDAAKALVKCGADLNVRSGKLHNNAPAGWAIVAGSADVFEYLLSAGAERLPWFLDDARGGCEGRFDQVSAAPRGQRERILRQFAEE